MRLQFLGATDTVTGSKYLLEHGGRRLLVDCGLFQGLKQLRLRNWDRLPFEVFEPIEGLRVRLCPAGHLLGAASVHAEADGHSVLFSGDLGRSDDILMKPPVPPVRADVVVIESTYGDRLHPQEDPLLPLAKAISRTAARSGMVLIPAFAVGRAQALLHCMSQLKARHRIPDLPVYLNSPMAADATEIYLRHLSDLRLTAEECRAMCKGVHIVNTIEESKRLNHLRWPSVIISASGMATGGRVLHHLKAYAGDARNTILFSGFQAAGTRGAALVAGADSIKIHGEYIPVRATVDNIASLSAHADRKGLLDWIGALPSAPRRVFVTHGEPVAADSLRQAIEERHRWPCEVPEYRQVVEVAEA